MVARICDVCGEKIGGLNCARYSLSYKTALYTRNIDICADCFNRLKEQIKESKGEQTEPKTTDCGYGEVEDEISKE